MSTNPGALDDADTVTLSRHVYERLVRDSKMLAALEGAGVDNWDGYSYALRRCGLTEEDDD